MENEGTEGNLGVTDNAMSGGSAHSPLVSVGTMVEVAEKAASHTSVVESEDKSAADMQSFLKEASALSGRGSVQDVQALLDRYPGLKEMGDTAMNAAQQTNTYYATDDEKEAAIRENHQNLMGGAAVLAGGAAAIAGASKEENGVSISSSLKDMLKGFSAGPEALGVQGRSAEVAHAGNTLLKSGLIDVENLGAAFSPKDALVAHGIPGKLRTQEAGMNV